MPDILPLVFECPGCPRGQAHTLLVDGWRVRRADFFFPADRVEIDGASPLGLVLNRRLLSRIGSAVGGWLEKNVAGRRPNASEFEGSRRG
jgi:hypothetical protein